MEALIGQFDSGFVFIENDPAPRDLDGRIRKPDRARFGPHFRHVRRPGSSRFSPLLHRAGDQSDRNVAPGRGGAVAGLRPDALGVHPSGSSRSRRWCRGSWSVCWLGFWPIVSLR